MILTTPDEFDVWMRAVGSSGSVAATAAQTMLTIVASGERAEPPSETAQAQPSLRFDGPGPSCGKLNGKQEANMNWIIRTDMNKQPIYVNIENASSIF